MIENGNIVKCLNTNCTLERNVWVVEYCISGVMVNVHASSAVYCGLPIICCKMYHSNLTRFNFIDNVSIFCLSCTFKRTIYYRESQWIYLALAHVPSRFFGGVYVAYFWSSMLCLLLVFVLSYVANVAYFPRMSPLDCPSVFSNVYLLFQ